MQGSRALPDEAFEAFEAAFRNSFAIFCPGILVNCYIIICEQIIEVKLSDLAFPTENLFDESLGNTLTLASPSY